MKAIWSHSKKLYEIEMQASEQGIVLAALLFAGDETGDQAFFEMYHEFRRALNEAPEKN